MSKIRRDPAFSGAAESTEQIQGHPAKGETQIERLQDQLADLLYPSEGGEIDIESLDALLELTGQRASQEIIDRVFENFCVGK